MNQTGVASTGSRWQARRKRGALAGVLATSTCTVGMANLTISFRFRQLTPGCSGEMSLLARQGGGSRVQPNESKGLIHLDALPWSDHVPPLLSPAASGASQHQATTSQASRPAT